MRYTIQDIKAIFATSMGVPYISLNDTLTTMKPDYGMEPKKSLFGGKKYKEELAEYEAKKADFETRKREDIANNIANIPTMIDSILDNIEGSLSRADKDKMVFGENDASLDYLFRILDLTTAVDKRNARSPICSLSAKQKARIYAISLAVFAKSNEIKKGEPNLDFYSQKSKRLGYSWDAGHLATFCKQNGIPMTKGDYDIMNEFLHTTCNEPRTVRGFDYDGEYAGLRESTDDYWAQLGVDIGTEKGRYGMGPKSRETQQGTNTTSAPRNAGTNTATRQTPSSSPRQEQASPVQGGQYPDNSTFGNLLRNAYAWFDRECKAKIKEQMDNGTAQKVNDFGFYNVDDPTGQRITFNYSTGYSKSQLNNMGRMKPNGKLRSSRDLQKELQIVEAYINYSGEVLKTKSVENMGGFSVSKEVIADSRIRTVLENARNTYSAWIRQAKESEMSNGPEGM